MAEQVGEGHSGHSSHGPLYRAKMQMTTVGGGRHRLGGLAGGGGSGVWIPQDRREADEETAWGALGGKGSL